MEWLAGNLNLAYPLGDQVTDPITHVIADGFVAAPALGIFTLTIFDPQALTNAHVQVKQGATVILETTTATVTTMGDYKVMEGVDTARGSRYRFIVSSAAIQTYALLTTPVEFAPNACVTVNPVVTSLNGLDGDVELTFDKFVSIQNDTNTVVSAQDPVDRVDCSETDCDNVFSLSGIQPDGFGSFVLANDGCHRAVPHPTEPHKLLLYNLCEPCLDCDDIDELNAKFAEQADYSYHLAAIHHDQFNRYQTALVAANRVEETLENISGTFAHTCGIVQIAGRSFNRPYFSQLVVAVTNTSTYELSVDLTAIVKPTALQTLLAGVSGSMLVQRFGPEGASTSTHDGLPGTITVTVSPGETVSVSAEVHLATIDDSVAASGRWHVDATINYMGGCATLPADNTWSKKFKVIFEPADPATEA
jgi:hypothetical protein